MKSIATLRFNLEDFEGRKSFNLATNADRLAGTLYGIHGCLFRPAFKHGYDDKAINELLEKLGDDGYKLVEMLSDRYNEYMKENNIYDVLENYE